MPSRPVLTAVAPGGFNPATAPIGPVSAEAAPGVPMGYQALYRVAVLVDSDLQAACPGRVLPAGAAAEPGEVKVLIYFRTYDQGNAEERGLLAGLGQIHINADVELTDAKSGNVVANYYVHKTFAWGGAYGEFVTIQDVEKGFAKSVVRIFDSHYGV